MLNIISQYEEMSLAHLKCIPTRRDARVTGRKLELFQQARTVESHTCHTIERCLSHMSDGRTLFILFQDYLLRLVFLHVSPCYVYF